MKFGYQLHRNVNLISQGYNEPEVQIFPGTQGTYTSISDAGGTNCASVGITKYLDPSTGLADCVGTYGTVNVNDYGTSGTASALNHGFFAQDAWTLGHGITINAGLRIEREYLPARINP